jgi:hypothetical protein
MAREQCAEFGECRERILRELVTEALELEHVQGLELLARVTMDHALRATQPVEGAVVEQHRHLVGAQLHIHLDVTRAGADRGLDADQCVFWIVQCITAMRDQLRDIHIDVLLPSVRCRNFTTLRARPRTTPVSACAPPESARSP